jgi:DNA-binding response OmpR family regulator
VLVVDDNRDMREYVATLLSADYAVETAPDGAAALELALADPPDLVLTDVMMPELDGFGLLAALREAPETRDVPVVMLSARAGDEGLLEGLEAGADDYLVKPFAARELLARVRANLELDRVRHTRDRLERSQALLDQAQRLAGVGSWELDWTTGAIHASDEFLRQLEVEREDLQVGGFEKVLSTRVHPHDLARVRGLIEQAAETGVPLDYETRIVLPSGSQRLMRTIAEVDRDTEHGTVRLSGANQDITEQRDAEYAVAHAAAAREASERERRIADELQRSLLPERTFQPDGLGRRDVLPGGRRRDAGRRRLVRRRRARRRPGRARHRRRHGTRREGSRGHGPGADRRTRVRADGPAARGRPRAARRRGHRPRRRSDRHLLVRDLRPGGPDARPRERRPPAAAAPRARAADAAADARRRPAARRRAVLPARGAAAARRRLRAGLLHRRPRRAARQRPRHRHRRARRAALRARHGRPHRPAHLVDVLLPDAQDDDVAVLVARVPREPTRRRSRCATSSPSRGRSATLATSSPTRSWAGTCRPTSSARRCSSCPSS